MEETNETHAPAYISVLWEGLDLEIKTINAVVEIVERAAELGLTPDGCRRVGAYMADRYSPTTTQKGE